MTTVKEPITTTRTTAPVLSPPRRITKAEPVQPQRTRQPVKQPVRVPA